MSVIRNRLNLSRYTVDVYRPTVAQAAVSGVTPEQWKQTRGAGATVTGVRVLIGRDPVLDEQTALGADGVRMVKMEWISDDIRDGDVVLIHGTDDPLDGLYFDVKNVRPSGTGYGVEKHRVSHLTERRAGWP